MELLWAICKVFDDINRLRPQTHTYRTLQLDYGCFICEQQYTKYVSEAVCVYINTYKYTYVYMRKFIYIYIFIYLFIYIQTNIRISLIAVSSAELMIFIFETLFCRSNDTGKFNFYRLHFSWFLCMVCRPVYRRPKQGS